MLGFLWLILGVIAAAGVFASVVLVPFMHMPVLAVVPAVGFLLLSRSPRVIWKLRGGRARVNVALAAAVAWIAFIPYESAMQRWYRSVSGAIRLDLGVVALLIVGLSAGALDRAIWG